MVNEYEFILLRGKNIFQKSHGKQPIVGHD